MRHEGLRKLLDSLKRRLGVDAHSRDRGARRVAQQAQRQRQILVHELAGLGVLGFLLDRFPELLQERHVGVQLLLRGTLGRRPHDVAAGRGLRGDQPLERRAQPLALGFGLDPRRHADAAAVRGHHEMPRRDRDVGGEARALRAERLLQYLHEQLLAVVHELADVRFAVVVRRIVFAAIDVGGADDVGRMQERGAIEPEIDERGLHAGQHPRHLSFIDVADQPTAARAFDEHLLEHAALDERGANLARRRVDEDLLALHQAVRASEASGSASRRAAVRRSLRGSGGSSPQRVTPQRPSSAAVSNSGSPTTDE